MAPETEPTRKNDAWGARHEPWGIWPGILPAYCVVNVGSLEVVWFPEALELTRETWECV
jgi:hypothetical protein